MFDQLKKIWARRDLLKYFVTTELKITYKHKLLGFLWTLLDPLMMMLVYIVLVVVIFKRGTPQFPVLLFCALLSWRWFTESASNSVGSLSKKGNLIQTVYFPKAILPLSKVMLGSINYLFGLIAFVPLLFLYEAKFTWNILWLPVLIFIQLIFTAGVALLFAVLGVYFRDLENILEFGLRGLFYLSPALYSVHGRIPADFIPIYMLNPFAALFESYKNILVLGKNPSEYMLITAIISIIIFISGFWFFNNKETDLAKNI